MMRTVFGGVLLLTAATSMHGESSIDSIQTGDLVFVPGVLNGRSEYENAISATGNATVAWMQHHGYPSVTNELSFHVALAWRNHSTSDLFFVEAIGLGVMLTSAKDFFHGRDSLYHAVLVDSALSLARADAVHIAMEQLGKPYASNFEKPPLSFYCSSLVDWAFQQAAGVTEAFAPADFLLIFDPVDYWKDYYAKMGLTLPVNVTGSNPTLLLHSPKLKFDTIKPSSQQTYPSIVE